MNQLEARESKHPGPGPESLICGSSSLFARSKVRSRLTSLSEIQAGQRASIEVVNSLEVLWTDVVSDAYVRGESNSHRANGSTSKCNKSMYATVLVLCRATKNPSQPQTQRPLLARATLLRIEDSSAERIDQQSSPKS